MISLQTDIFDVPTANTAILVIRETAALARTFFFRNLYSSTLTIQIQYSADGTTWVNESTAFSLTAAGSGTEVAVKSVSNLNMLRIQASGGGDSKDLEIGLVRLSLETDPQWTKPVL